MLAPVLYMWTIFDHPKDFPDTFVARRFAIMQGTAVPTDAIVVSPDIGKLRDFMVRHGFTCLGREVGDDPKIVETWV